jgi:DNA processing protein
MNDRLEEIRLARLALGWLVEPGNRAVYRSVSRHGPVRVLDGLLSAGLDDRLRREAGARLGVADPRALAEAALRRAERLGARVVIPEGDEWPRQLEDLRHLGEGESAALERDVAPPLYLWVRGPWRLDEALERSVAVVGARAATPYGEHTARQIGYELAQRDWAVVSGGAFGVDAQAHRGALAAGGLTVVVLASGVDRPYPVSHANLFDRVAEDGLVISEWPPDTDPFRHRFLIRNRVIAAATRGTVVVEAAARSGALQTLRRAGQLHRPAMVVPGPVTSAMSVGCHEWLRRDGVRLVTGVEHILEEVGRVGADLAAPPRGPDHARDGLDPIRRRLVEALLRRKPLPLEAVAARAGVPLRDAMRLVPGLVTGGFAVARGAGYVLAPHLLPGRRPAGSAPTGGPVSPAERA